MNKLSLFIIVGWISCLPLFSQTHDTLFNQTDANGMKQGFWKATFDNGKLKYKGYFKNGKPLGFFVRYYEDGTRKAVMNYLEDGHTVDVSLYYQDDSLAAKGKYVDMKKEGAWLYYSFYNHALTCRESYSNGKKNGLSVKYYPSQVISEELEYHNDLKDGEWKQYYENGTLRLIAHYAKNNRDGEYKVYYPSGNKQVEGSFKNDKLEGKWIYYNDDGKPDLELVYVNGEVQNPEQLEERQKEMFKFIEESKGKYPEPDETNFLNPVK